MELSNEVKKLGHQVKERATAQEQTRAREKERTARKREVDEAIDRARTDFWCSECRQDYSAIGHKRVATGFDLDKGETYLSNPLRARYEAKCVKGHDMFRHITDKHLDPYFNLSLKVKHERALHADDMLTPADERFRVVYPKIWEELEARREAYARENSTGHQS